MTHYISGPRDEWTLLLMVRNGVTKGFEVVAVLGAVLVRGVGGGVTWAVKPRIEFGGRLSANDKTNNVTLLLRTTTTNRYLTYPDSAIYFCKNASIFPRLFKLSKIQDRGKKLTGKKL